MNGQEMLLILKVAIGILTRHIDLIQREGPKVDYQESAVVLSRKKISI